jgi:hypothetical protein
MPLEAMPRFTMWTLLAVGCAFGAAAATNKLSPARAVVEYHGESIRLSRVYYDYEEYKNDPSNIHPDETVRVQRLVAGAPVARTYPDRKSLFGALSELPFPGYGSGSRETKQADGTKLLLYEVEIPRADATRYLVFRERAGTYSLVDDFVSSDSNPIIDVRDAPDGLAYSHPRGKVTVRQPSFR